MRRERHEITVLTKAAFLGCRSLAAIVGRA